MNKPATHRLDACLEQLVRRTEHLKQIKLSRKKGRAQALEASQSLQALILQYRHLLKQWEQD